MTGSMSRTRPRVLYLIVLFLSVSPAAHIFVLIAKFFSNDSSSYSSLPSFILGRHNSEEETANKENSNNNNENHKLDHHGSIVGQLVENGQVALEEILYVFDEDTRRHVSRKMTISFMVPTLSFLLLGMIPCFIWCYNFIKSKICNFKQQSGSSGKQERKQQKLRHILQKYMLILQEDADDSIQTNNKRSTSKTARKWNVPIPGMALDMKQILLREQPMLPRNHYDREVDGECPICLTEFRCGDCLVWSSNSMCSHCFHYDCILSWLEQQEEGYHRTTTRSRRKLKKACPCCRQPFIY